MNGKLAELVSRIRELEDEVEAEVAKRREELHFTLEEKKISFEQAILEEHRRLKTGLFQYLREAKLRNVLSAPIIYGMFFPLLLMDIAVSFYQWTCFPLYGIPLVRRVDFFVYDRHYLAYLNIVEKFHCFYCAYANGLAAYIKQIIALTEQYWCPIKHARRIIEAHSRYRHFVDFGDAETYRKKLDALRQDFGPDAD
jgi:hypothetical protein